MAQTGPEIDPRDEPNADEDGDGTASDPHRQAEQPPAPAEPGGGAPDEDTKDDADG